MARGKNEASKENIVEVNDERDDERDEIEKPGEVTKQPVSGERYAPTDYGKNVVIKIPQNELNPNDDVIPVRINQYKWNIKRGVEVTVPEEVKKILENAKYI